MPSHGADTLLAGALPLVLASNSRRVLADGKGPGSSMAYADWHALPFAACKAHYFVH